MNENTHDWQDVADAIIAGDAVPEADAAPLRIVRRNLLMLSEWDMLSMDADTFRAWCTEVAAQSDSSRLSDAPWALALIDEAVEALDEATATGGFGSDSQVQGQSQSRDDERNTPND